MEFALHEWGIDHIRIRRTWTMEQLELLMDKLVERKRQEAEAWSGKSGTGSHRVGAGSFPFRKRATGKAFRG